MEMFLSHLTIVYIFHNLFVLWEYVLILIIEFNNRNQVLTVKLLKQGYQYHKLHKAFSKFYNIRSELIIKYNIHLKTLLQQGISVSILLWFSLWIQNNCWKP